MALLLMDGFDKYGGTNTNGAGVQTLLQAGEWTSVAGTGVNIVAPLSATGFALLLSASTGINKTLTANYARLIGGLRFNGSLATSSCTLFQPRDSGSPQCTLTLETTGVINLRSSTVNGTILSGSGAVAANSTHYVEWDITIGTAGAYQVWLDGVSLFSGTGNTRGGTANNYANGVAIAAGSGPVITVDDFYLFDSTGTTNNAVLLTSPRIETTFPTSDSAVQFGFGAAVLGTTISRVGTFNAPTANSINLRRFVPVIAMTINSIGVIPHVASGTANYRGVIYADSAGAAGTLMSSGTTVTGTSVDITMTLPLTTPQSLTAGTSYWLGFMSDTAVNHQVVDGSATGYRAAATFSSGAPGTAPAMTSGQPTFVVWGNVTGITGNNWYEAAQQPPPGVQSYVFDATVGHEDLYNFNALSVPPTNIYAVAVKGYLTKSDSGTKTVSLRTKSGATDSGGSLTGQALGTSYGWMTSIFETNPATSAAWTGAALNAATSGVRVDS